MPTCYPPLSINVESVDFNSGNTGYTSYYISPDPSCEPTACVLPSLVDTDLTLSAQTLTTPQGGCKYTFNNVFPIPPIFIPKPVIPIVPCPQGIIIESAITIVGTGSASTTGSISVTGGPCNFLIGGIIDINVPPIPCSNGTSFSSNVTNNSGVSSLDVLGGPCNFALVGNIGTGIGPGSFQSCPNSPSMTVTDLFTVDMSGNPILNFPPVCTDCNSSNAGAFTLTDPIFNTLHAEQLYTAACCSVGVVSELDLCGGSLTLLNGTNNMYLFTSGTPNITFADASGNSSQLNTTTAILTDSSGNTSQIGTSAITITGVSSTVTIDSAATGGNNISFQLVNVCVSGTNMQMYVLGSAPF